MTYARSIHIQTAVADAVSADRNLSDGAHVARTLAATPEFAGWEPRELSRLIPYLWERHIPQGDLLCREGEPADHAFCLLTGSVWYEGGSGRPVTTGFIGHEAALDSPAYLANVKALTDVVVLVMPRTVLEDFGITLGGKTLYHSLLARHTASTIDDEAFAKPIPPEEPEPIGLVKPIGWGLTLLLPLLIILFGDDYGLAWNQKDFLAALSVCLMMMFFNLTAQYAAALIAGLACLLMNVAPPSVILSGFASDGFFMGLSIFGLGAVLTSSGLAERIVLNILKRSPRSPFWYNVTILFTGVLMTPCLPSANTRVALMTPLIMETSRSLGYQDRSRAATHLMFSMFAGASLFAPAFLTAKSLNFVVHSMMPVQIRDEFQWLTWTVAASVTMAIVLGLYLLLSTVMFRNEDKPQLSGPHLDTQLRLLGPMRPAEWTALAVAVSFILAIVSYSIHKISPAWITLAVLCVFLVLGILNEKNIRHDFQWDVLLMVGFFIGLEQTLDYTGFTASLTNTLSDITGDLESNLLLFLALMAGVTAVLRLFLPITTTGVLVASVFLPLAALNGINAWVVGFALIIFSETWFLPAQCSYYVTMQDMSGDKPVHDEALFLRLNAISMVLRLLALLASLPFFRYLGLI
ncbi:MAG: SLC13 family permease [Gammaproteobacteria bacterium]